MRILVIRGKNLASLAEAFTLDLEAEPLRGAGLFAITGETGAGKSTILDALCLALYGTTPRLEGDGDKEEIPDPSGKSMKAKDPRTVLRRGASEGMAEVEFASHDGARHRATWLVRRAHGKAAGAVMHFERMLMRLGHDGAWAPIATGKKQVETAIEELTELDFAQFRRTALLAQGEFDAFLRADDSQRADILEKITATGVYGRISIDIHRQADAATRAVAELKARRDAIAVLDDAALAGLADRRQAAEVALARLSQEAASLTQEKARRIAFDEAEHRVATATAALDAALAASQQGEPLRQRRALIARVEPMRRVLEDDAKARRDRVAQAAAAERALDTLEAAKIALSEALARQEQCEATYASEAALVEGLEPIWALASARDALVEAAEKEFAATAAGLSEATEKLANADSAVSALRAALATVNATEAALREREDALASLRPFVPLWPGLRDQLSERRDLRASLDAARGDQNQAMATIDRARASIADLTREDAADEAERSTLLAQIDARSDILRALAETDLPVQRHDLAKREAAHRIAMTAKTAHAGALVRLENAHAAGRAAEANTIEASALARRHESELAGLRARRQAQQAGFDLAVAIDRQETAALRGVLIDGEPCPVCGSTSHPVTSHGDAITALARQLKDDRQKLDAAILDTERHLSEATQRAAQAAGLLDSARLAMANAEADAAREAATFGTVAYDLGLEAIDSAGPALTQLEATLRLERQSLDDRQKAVETAREDREILRASLAKLTQRRDERREAITLERKVEADAAVTVAKSGEVIAQATSRIAAIDAALQPLLEAAGLAPDDLGRDAGGVAARLEAAFEALRNLAVEREAIDQQRTTTEDGLRTAADAKERCTEAVAVAKRRHEERESARRTAIAERRALLDGEATVSHRERTLRGLSIVRQAAETAREATAAATQRCAVAQAQSLAANEMAAKAATEAQRLTLAVEAGCAGLGLARAAIEDLLAVPSDDVIVMDKAIAALDADIVSARAVLADALGALDSLGDRGGDEPLRDPATLDGLLADIETERQRHHATLGEITGLLATDAAAHDRAGAMGPEIEAAVARLETVMAVDQAIGSHDGSRFRRFAQGVTLDRLVALANIQLVTLSPRYRLKRADLASLGLHIIDRDMGDQIRSTRSLSGGERFLASLALALALSGLEGRRSFVDTLFIDEGFGALDAATLDVAIDALEALQSQGRRVGVISHVAAMIERIAIQVRVEKAGAGRSTVRVAVATRD